MTAQDYKDDTESFPRKRTPSEGTLSPQLGARGQLLFIPSLWNVGLCPSTHLETGCSDICLTQFQIFEGLEIKLYYRFTCSIANKYRMEGMGYTDKGTQGVGGRP